MFKKIVVVGLSIAALNASAKVSFSKNKMKPEMVKKLEKAVNDQCPYLVQKGDLIVVPRGDKTKDGVRTLKFNTSVISDDEADTQLTITIDKAGKIKVKSDTDFCLGKKKK